MKAIKAFMPYVVGPALYKWCGRATKASPDKLAEVLKAFVAVDPTGYQWDTMGLIAPLNEGMYVHDLDGKARVLMYQFNDRILPGAVRDEVLQRRVTELAEKSGRAVTKQEYAQLRDEVEEELLPKAFIRRTAVPVLVFDDTIMFCTTSARRVEQMVGHLSRLCTERNVELGFEHINTKTGLTYFMGEIANGVDIGQGNSHYFEAGTSGVFKGSGEDKRTVRVKDRDMQHEEIAQIIGTTGYMVTELGMRVVDGGSVEVEFTLTNKWVVKGIKLAGIEAEMKEAEDQHATLWLYAVQFRTLLSAIVDALNEDLGEPTDGGATDQEEDL